MIVILFVLACFFALYSALPSQEDFKNIKGIAFLAQNCSNPDYFCKAFYKKIQNKIAENGNYPVEVLMGNLENSFEYFKILRTCQSLLQKNYKSENSDYLLEIASEMIELLSEPHNPVIEVNKKLTHLTASFVESFENFPSYNKDDVERFTILSNCLVFMEPNFFANSFNNIFDFVFACVKNSLEKWDDFGKKSMQDKWDDFGNKSKQDICNILHVIFLFIYDHKIINLEEYLSKISAARLYYLEHDFKFNNMPNRNIVYIQLFSTLSDEEFPKGVEMLKKQLEANVEAKKAIKLQLASQQAPQPPPPNNEDSTN